MKKKTILLASAMLISMWGWAQGEGNVTFTDNAVKAICVTNWDTDGDGELSKAEAAAVSNLGTAFKSNTEITSFDELQYFTGISSIVDFAFYGCSSLNTISIPKSVSSIGWYAFDGCSSLNAVHISDLEAWCKIKFAYIYNSNPLSVAHHLFLNGEEVKELIIPNSITSIPYGAFHGCSGLTSVIIPNSVESIGQYAFSKCSGLTSVVIPDGVTSIKYNAFEDCIGLTSITIPNSLTSIDYSAFQGCSGLGSIAVETGNTKYESRNNCNAIIDKYNNTLVLGCKNTIIPNSVTSIGWGAFNGCSGMSSITIPNSVTSIDVSAFANCSSLSAVHISDLGSWCRIRFNGASSNPLSAAHHLFLNGEEIKELSIPASVTSIGSYAFYGCSDLTAISIPNSVTKVGKLAFYGCNNVQSFIVPEHFKRTIHVTTAGTLSEQISRDEKYQIMELTLTGELNGTDIHLIRDMAGANMDRMEAEFCISCNETIFTDGILRVLDLSGANIVEGGRDYYKMLYSSARNEWGDKQYTKANAITKYMFSYCMSLGKLVLPSSVTSIEDRAFYECSGLTSISVNIQEPLVIENSTFSNYANVTLYVPKGSKEKYQEAEGWKNFENIVEMNMAEVKLSKTSLALVKGKSSTLKATVTPETLADQGVTWESSDTRIATVTTSGKVKGVRTGVAVITCTSVSDPNAFATCEVTVGLVSLDKSELAIEKGSTATLKAIVYPTSLTDKSVTWKSSDTRIATVSSTGKVKGVRTGKATITCKSKATGLIATCEVIVGLVSLNKSELAIEKGKTATLKATVYPTSLTDKSVTWESSDTRIATVSSAGKVRGVRTGKATITCTSKATGLIATCEVTVGLVSLNKSELTIVMGKTATLKATVYPSTLTDQSVTWKSSNKGIATVSKAGKVKGVKAGTATITCTSVATGLSTTCKVTVSAAAGARQWDEEDATGLDEVENASATKPFDVYDLSGRKVLHQVTSLDGLPAGIYIVNGKKIMKK